MIRAVRSNSSDQTTDIYLILHALNFIHALIKDHYIRVICAQSLKLCFIGEVETALLEYIDLKYTRPVARRRYPDIGGTDMEGLTILNLQINILIYITVTNTPIEHAHYTT